MRFDNGTLGTLTSGYYLDRGYHEHIRVWGSGGWMELDLLADVPLSCCSTQGEIGRIMKNARKPFHHTAI